MRRRPPAALPDLLAPISLPPAPLAAPTAKPPMRISLPPLDAAPRGRVRAHDAEEDADDSDNDSDSAALPAAKRVRRGRDLAELLAMQIKAQAAHDRLELERLRRSADDARAREREHAAMLDFMAQQTQLMRNMMAALTREQDADGDGADPVE